MNQTTKVTLGLSALLCTNLSFAGVFAVNSVGAQGTAMQAFTAVADDASAIYYNPAGITQINKRTVMGGGDLIFPKINYNNTAFNQTLSSTRSAIGGHAFFVTPIKQQWRLGVGVFSPYARIARYPTGPATPVPATSGQPLSRFLNRIDVAPTVAYAVNEQLSIGLSGVVSHMTLDTDALGLNERGSGYGLSYQAGLMWQMTPKVKLGASIRGPETARLKGMGTLRPANTTSNYVTRIHMPAVVNVGLALKATPKLLASIEYNNEMWSSLQAIVRDYDSPVFNAVRASQINGYNSNNYRAGFAYQATNTDKLLAGFTHSEAAAPINNALPIGPEFNSNFYSIGLSHQAQKFRVDIAYEYADLLKATKTAQPLPGQMDGRVHRLLFNVAMPL